MTLLIGPRRNKNKSQIGGSEVLFENWISFCNENNIPIKIVDGNKFNYSNKIFALIFIAFSIFKNAHGCKDIFLHGSNNDYLFLAPLAVLAGKMFRKKVFLKKFGGGFLTVYNNAPWWGKKIYRYAMNYADFLFWETKCLVDFGKKFNSNSYWFPNTRKRPDFPIERHSFKKRFVFISQVRKEKGIDILLETFRNLGDDCQLDIYGSLMGYTEYRLEGYYKGILAPNDIYRTLSKYDFLILPTLFKSEGYPGIITEAFAVGCPVIASKTGGIPEMVKDGENGFLIDPDEPDSLITIIKSLDFRDYDKLSQCARRSFNDFDAEIINNRILRYIENEQIGIDRV
jgi:glycosyltransferase involved in cell wall biosynthesis